MHRSPSQKTPPASKSNRIHRQIRHAILHEAHLSCQPDYEPTRPKNGVTHGWFSPRSRGFRAARLSQRRASCRHPASPPHRRGTSAPRFSPEPSPSPASLRLSQAFSCRLQCMMAFILSIRLSAQVSIKVLLRFTGQTRGDTTRADL